MALVNLNMIIISGAFNYEIRGKVKTLKHFIDRGGFIKYMIDPHLSQRFSAALSFN